MDSLPSSDSLNIKKNCSVGFLQGKILIIIGLLFLVIQTDFLANTIYVPLQYSTIQDAINSSNNGDTVLVSPGVYIESVNYNGKSIVLASNYILNNDTSYITSTIIDGDSLASTVSIISGEDSTTCLIGFTIRNGLGKIETGILNYTGGGISCKNSSKPNIVHCLISDNNAFVGGGILVSHASSPTIDNCSINSNTAQANGGGIYSLNNDPFIKGITKIDFSTIEDNIANSGGGISVGENGLLVAISSLIIKNVASHRGGGIAGYFCSQDYINCIISQNKVLDINGKGGGIGIGIMDLSVLNSIIWGNLAGNYRNIFMDNPDEVRLGYSALDTSANGVNIVNPWQLDIFNLIYTHPEFSDIFYHLSPFSPCIDGGDPTSSYSNEPFFNGRRINIGVYGNTVEATTSNPEIEVQPIVLNFDSLSIQNSDTLDLWIFNNGTTRLNVDSLVIQGEGFDCLHDSSSWIMPGDSLEVPVLFQPQRTLMYYSELHIYSNDRNEREVIILLGGTGLLEGIFSGELSKDYSPFYVSDNIVVPTGDSLIIEKGCQLYFPSSKSINVDSSATLICLGSEQDSIRFSPKSPSSH